LEWLDEADWNGILNNGIIGLGGLESNIQLLEWLYYADHNPICKY
jgi:hypothetical protein